MWRSTQSPKGSLIYKLSYLLKLPPAHLEGPASLSSIPPLVLGYGGEFANQRSPKLGSRAGGNEGTIGSGCKATLTLKE